MSPAPTATCSHPGHPGIGRNDRVSVVVASASTSIDRIAAASAYRGPQRILNQDMQSGARGRRQCDGDASRRHYYEQWKR